MELGLRACVPPTHNKPLTEDDQVVMIEFKVGAVAGLEEEGVGWR